MQHRDTGILALDCDCFPLTNKYDKRLSRERFEPQLLSKIVHCFIEGFELNNVLPRQHSTTVVLVTITLCLCTQELLHLSMILSCIIRGSFCDLSGLLAWVQFNLEIYTSGQTEHTGYMNHKYGFYLWLCWQIDVLCTGPSRTSPTKILW